jgi:plasmid stabilization system protein ParE
MMPRYRLARSAKRNLQEISDYWSERASADVALQIVTGIVETIITLATQPRMGVAADRNPARIPWGA